MVRQQPASSPSSETSGRPPGRVRSGQTRNSLSGERGLSVKTSEPTRAPRRNHSGFAVLISLIGLVTGVGIPSPGSVHAQTGTVLRSFVPSPTGNGRAVAFDGGTTLYYTRRGDTDIYRVTTSGESLSAIPQPEAGGRGQCGAFSWDSTPRTLWCGAFRGRGAGVYV